MKNINRIVGDSLNDMTKQYTKYKQLYTQNCIETNTLKSSVHQYKKEYDTILKKEIIRYNFKQFKLNYLKNNYMIVLENI